MTRIPAPLTPAEHTNHRATTTPTNLEDVHPPPAPSQYLPVARPLNKHDRTAHTARAHKPQRQPPRRGNARPPPAPLAVFTSRTPPQQKQPHRPHQRNTQLAAPPQRHRPIQQIHISHLRPRGSHQSYAPSARTTVRSHRQSTQLAAPSANPTKGYPPAAGCRTGRNGRGLVRKIPRTTAPLTPPEHASLCATTTPTNPAGTQPAAPPAATANPTRECPPATCAHRGTHQSHAPSATAARSAPAGRLFLPRKDEHFEGADAGRFDFVL